jgi:hypothetical protein
MSSSPQAGQGVPERMSLPSSQNAGHSPCLVLMLLAPKRICASAMVRRPLAGVNVYLDSTRPEVQDDPSCQGTSCSVLPPDVWTCRGLRLYVCSSLLTPRLPSMMFQLFSLGSCPLGPAKVSAHTRL